MLGFPRTLPAFCAQLPSQLDDVLNRYAEALELEGPGGEEAYLFSPRSATDRPLESSAYTQAVKRAFKKFSPGAAEISPKTLRSSFMYATLTPIHTPASSADQPPRV